MAVYKPKEVEHEGLLAPPVPIRLGKDGGITPGMIVSLNQTLTAIVSHINGGLSMGTAQAGTRTGNMRNQWLVFVSPGTADLEFELPHGLGRVPFGYTTWFVDKAAIVYASRYGSWNRERIFLKVNATSVNCILEVA